MKNEGLTTNKFFLMINISTPTNNRLTYFPMLKER